jgi:hypothetical protein
LWVKETELGSKKTGKSSTIRQLWSTNYGCALLASVVGLIPGFFVGGAIGAFVGAFVGGAVGGAVGAFGDSFVAGFVVGFVADGGGGAYPGSPVASAAV